MDEIKVIVHLFIAEADESVAKGKNHVVIMFTESMMKGSWDSTAGA